jgi:hypothetical protein
MRPNTLNFLIGICLLIFSCREIPFEMPVTRDEALTMSKKIDSAVANNKSDYFISLISERAFAGRVKKVTKVNISAGMLEGLHAGLVKADLVAQIKRSLSDESGGYELVKHYEKDKAHHLIYRLYGTDGLNYTDFELTKVDGKVQIADMFFYISGENLSKSLADFVTQLTNEQAYKGVKKEDLQAMQTIKLLLTGGRHEEAKKIYDRLPDVMKNQKLVQVLHIAICGGLDDQTYANALDEFELRYRHEPNMLISLIDSYIMRKDFTSALDAVNKVDSMIDKDPFLDYFRYSFYTQLNKPQEALQAIENLNKAMPHFDAGVVELIVTYLEEGQYEKARPLVRSYRSNEKFNQDLLEQNLVLFPGFEPEK